MKFKRQWQIKYKGTITGEINQEPSKTIPDQALSLRELLENHSRGIESDQTEYRGEYFEETEIPRFDDITDLHEYRRKLERQSKELEAQIKAENAEKKKKDAEAAESKKVAQTAPKGAPATPKASLEQVPDKGQEIKGTE